MKMRCIEEPSLIWDDRQTILWLCSQGSQQDVSEDLQAFLEYVLTNVPSNELTRKLQNAVESVRLDEKWGEEYMTLDDMILDAREEGRAEGASENQLQIIQKLLHKGLSEAEVCNLLDLSEKELQAALSICK